MREIVDGITDEQMNSIIRVGNSYCCEYVWLSKEKKWMKTDYMYWHEKLKQQTI